MKQNNAAHVYVSGTNGCTTHARKYTQKLRTAGFRFGFALVDHVHTFETIHQHWGNDTFASQAVKV